MFQLEYNLTGLCLQVSVIVKKTDHHLKSVELMEQLIQMNVWQNVTMESFGVLENESRRGICFDFQVIRMIAFHF